MFLMATAHSANWALSLNLTTRRVCFQHNTGQPSVDTWQPTKKKKNRQMHTHTHACTSNTHIKQSTSIKGFVGQVWSWICDKQLYGRLKQKGGAGLSQGQICWGKTSVLMHTPGALSSNGHCLQFTYIKTMSSWFGTEWEKMRETLFLIEAKTSDQKWKSLQLNSLNP